MSLVSLPFHCLFEISYIWRERETRDREKKTEEWRNAIIDVGLNIGMGTTLNIFALTDNTVSVTELCLGPPDKSDIIFHLNTFF